MNVTFPTLLVLRAFLCAPDPLSGYEILKDPHVGTNPGTLYPMLARLVRARWIVRTATLSGPSAPPAHFYTITPAGRVAFLEMLCRLTISSDLWATPAQRPQEPQDPT